MRKTGGRSREGRGAPEVPGVGICRHESFGVDRDSHHRSDTSGWRQIGHQGSCEPGAVGTKKPRAGNAARGLEFARGRSCRELGPRAAPGLEPSEGEQDKRYDERHDRAEGVEVRDAGGRIYTRWNKPVHDGAGKEHNAKKSGDQRPGSVHRRNLPTNPARGLTGHHTTRRLYYSDSAH
jgi:hypothetical protein